MVAVMGKTRGTEIICWIFSHRNNAADDGQKRKTARATIGNGKNSKVEESLLTTIQEINRYISTRLYIP
jgi:hypothetical protein